jgi:hypothetical protein
MREYFAHFLADLGKSCHNLEKKNKTQVQTPCLQALRRWPMGSAVFFIMIFGFLESFTDLGKGCQNFEKTKKTADPLSGGFEEMPHGVCSFLFF